MPSWRLLLRHFGKLELIAKRNEVRGCLAPMLRVSSVRLSSVNRISFLQSHSTGNRQQDWLLQIRNTEILHVTCRSQSCWRKQSIWNHNTLCQLPTAGYFKQVNLKNTVSARLRVNIESAQSVLPFDFNCRKPFSSFIISFTGHYWRSAWECVPTYVKIWKLC